MKGIAYYKSREEMQCELIEQQIHDLKRKQYELMPGTYINPDKPYEQEDVFYKQSVSLYPDKNREIPKMIFKCFIGGVILLILCFCYAL